MKMNLKQGDLENIILNALWALEGEGLTKVYVGDIQEKIKADNPDAKEWAYTTVKTVLDRLVDKEIATREKDGKKFLYRSQLKREEAGALAVTKLLRQYFRNDFRQLEACIQQIRNQSDTRTSGMTRPSNGFKADVKEKSPALLSQ